METKIDYEKMFEDGSMLNRNYAGHEQFLMNKGTFIEIAKQITAEAIRLAAPLFAKIAENSNEILFNIEGDPEYRILNKQSIIDAVESITKQIV
jgi:hypothetical protein